MYTNVYTDVSIRRKSSTTHEENTDVNVLFTSCFASMGEVGKNDLSEPVFATPLAS